MGEKMEITSGGDISQMANLNRSNDLKDLQQSDKSKKEDNHKLNLSEGNAQNLSFDSNRGQNIDILS